MLHAAGAEKASLILVATDKQASTTQIVSLLKHEFPNTPVMARAFDRGHALELANKGVDFQIRETFESALVLGREAAILLGADAEEADELIEGVRTRDRQRFALQTVDGVYAGRDLLLANAKAQAGH
ncbi:Glutathione-regulated potassium-efflux system protein KefC [compost metagenome]